MTTRSDSITPYVATSGRLAGRIYDLIKERLLDGAFPGGEKLSVANLREEFGVSKQPIMEALRLLSADGLVEIYPQIGCVVTKYSPDEVSDFFRMFAAFEASVAQAAASRRSDSQLDDLRSLSRKMELLNEERDASVISKEYRLQNRKFHEAIHHMASSRIMADLSRRMWDLSDFLINTAGSYRAFGEVIIERNEDHAGIIEALELGEPELARERMEQHILGSPGIVSRD